MTPINIHAPDKQMLIDDSPKLHINIETEEILSEKICDEGQHKVSSPSWS